MTQYTLEALAAARDYFRQPEPRFWIWGDDAISWNDGVTIVFHRELTDILRRLAMDGLPRFTPLLLLLAACRDSYRRERVREALAREKSLLTGSSAALGPASDELLAALDRVAALPADLRSTIDAKATLIETVFEGRRFFPSEHALGLIDLVRSLPPHELLDDGVPADTRPHVTSALLVMGQALRELNVEALRLRLRTGLEQLVEPTALEPPEEESLRAFIARLRDDPELEGLGRLAHDLLAAVQVPRAVSDPDDLRLGGVSDIANRGPLDRLLVSELAYDDLTLAVRVAVGEALYLRRESPPRTPVRERSLLVDCGLRLWGVPRVFATAVALALAATADRHTKVAAWRAIGEDIEPVDLCSREGLAAHLEKLETTPQPASALPSFFEAIGQAEVADAILVTHEDVLADRDFRRALDELGDRPCYLATVDRDGRFRLRAHCGRGTRLVREAQFDLDRLLSPAGRPQKPLIKTGTGSDLPAILSYTPFPLLLPHQVNVGRLAFHEGHGAVTVTHDRRLMHWRQRGLGAAELTASVPKGPLHLISLDGKGTVRLIAGSGGNAPVTLLVCDVKTGAHRTMPIGTDVPITAVYERQVLYLIGKQAIRVVTDLGQLSAPLECRFKHFKHSGRRFFTRVNNLWYALSFDGQSPRLARVPIHASIDANQIVAMFELHGSHAPWVITKTGRVACTLNGTNLWDGFEKGSISVLRISDSGQSIVLARLTGPEPGAVTHVEELHLDVDARRMKLRSATGPAVWHPGLGVTLTGSLPHRFHQIGINNDGYLTLIGRRRRGVTFGAGWPQARAAISNGTAGDLRQARTFVPADGPPDVGYALRLARWSDGSRAWLDSRGLLHLKSGDRTLPELTLVIVPTGNLAAWSSDGRFWGPTFYTGIDARDNAPPADLLAAIDAFLIRLQ